MSACGGKMKRYSDEPQRFDPLGPSASGNLNTPTGGPEARDAIFKSVAGKNPQMQADSQAIAGGLRSAAQNPGWGLAQDEAYRNLRGDYLGGTQEFNNALNRHTAETAHNSNAVRTAANAQAADQVANIQDQMARGGVGFSTANQQATQAAQAAATARANELQLQALQGSADLTGNARINNYAQERQRMTQGGQQLDQALSAPLQYLESVPSSQVIPEQLAAQLVAGLTTGSQLATPNSTLVKKPGAMDYIGGATQAIGNL